MSAALIAALTPLAIDAGASLVDKLLAAAPPGVPSAESVAEAKRLAGELNGLEVRIAAQPESGELLENLVQNKRAAYALALERVRVSAAWEKHGRGSEWADAAAHEGWRAMRVAAPELVRLAASKR